MTDPKIILSHLPHFLQLAIFIAVSLAFKAIFSYEAPLTDVFAYKEHYESGNLCNWFWRRLFRKSTGKDGNVQVPLYRVLQAANHIIFWALAFIIFYRYFPWYVWAAEGTGVLLSYYFMVYERLYYKIAKQESLLLTFQSENINTYWLSDRLYFSGYWLFVKKESVLFNTGDTIRIDNGFRLWKFDLSCLIGIAVLILTSFIFLTQ